MENELTEVIQCAEWLERLTIRSSLGKISKRFALNESSLNLRRLHARVQELEGMLEAVGAGGVSAQRVTQADTRDTERWGSEPVTGTPFLQEEDQHLLDRFIETTEDNEGFDIGKEAIKRLANLGVVESLGFGRYGVTVFGYWVHEHYWYQNPSLPLKTNLDRDADARAAIAVANENK